MTKLSDTQAVVLSAAAQRDDGAVLPLPETLRIKGGAVAKVLGSLKARGLIEHQGIPRGNDPPPLRITRAGLEAIGVETEDYAPEGATPPDTGATSAEAGVECVMRFHGRPSARSQISRRSSASSQDSHRSVSSIRSIVSGAAAAGRALAKGAPTILGHRS